MTEPVAYLVTNPNGYQDLTFDKPNIGYIDYLYSASQLNKRVKMTQAEFYEWKELYYRVVELSLTACKILNEISDNAHNSIGKYTKLAKRVYQDNEFMSVSKKQTELVNLFINYSPDTPEETIEIVKNMKWFVRSKEPEEYDDEYYLFLSGSNLDDLDYLAFDYARAFDTKEEAEKWTNPLTEAVQLPVEVNND